MISWLLLNPSYADFAVKYNFRPPLIVRGRARRRYNQVGYVVKFTLLAGNL